MVALGLFRSRFANPHGLSDSGAAASSALDIAKLSCAAMSEPRLAQILGCRSFECRSGVAAGGRRARWASTNTYLGDTRVAAGLVVDGVKTGITPGAQACLVLRARSDAAHAAAAAAAHQRRADHAAAGVAAALGADAAGQRLAVFGAAVVAGAAAAPPSAGLVDEFLCVTLASRTKAMRFIDNVRLLQWGSQVVSHLRGDDSAGGGSGGGNDAFKFDE